jgi:CDP-diglyceride synthetase
MEIMNAYWDIFLLYVPVFVANSVPVIVCNIPFLKKWNTPLSLSYFGKNKTWRGFIFGVGIAILVAGLQFFTKDQSVWQGFLWGGLLGVGALGGDVIESFFKRQIGIAPGKPLPILDGIDYIVGALILGSFLYIPTISEIIFLLLVGPILSFCANVLAYLCGLKKVWY